MKRCAAFLLSTALTLCATHALSSPPANGSADRLQRPAQPVDAGAATNLLLLDITRAGARLVAVGEQGVILLSDDGGKQWRQAQVPTSVLLTAVSFADAENGWAVGHDGVVLHTEDGGERWTQQLDGNRINARRLDALNEALAELAQMEGAAEDYAEREETLSYALDDAAVAQEEGATTPLLDLVFTSAGEGYAVGAYGTFLRTRDGGISWQSMDHRLPNPDRFHLNAILQAADGTLYLAGEAGLLLVSHDGGEQWQVLDTGYEGSFFAMQEADQLYVMGLRGHLFRSSDGVEWHAVELPVQATLNGALRDPQGQLLLLGQAGLLLQQAGDDFVARTAGTRTSFAAGVLAGEEIILVGERGVTRVTALQAGGRS